MDEVGFEVPTYIIDSYSPHCYASIGKIPGLSRERGADYFSPVVRTLPALQAAVSARGFRESLLDAIFSLDFSFPSSC